MHALALMSSRIVAAGCALLLVACGAGNQVAPAVRTEMVAVDAATGRQLWRSPLGEELIGSPAVWSCCADRPDICAGWMPAPGGSGGGCR